MGTLQMFKPFFWLVPVLIAALPAHAVTPSIVVHAYTVNVEVNADGTAVATYHIEQTPSSQAAASQIGQYSIAFNPTLQRLDIDEAYTRKRDGKRVPIDISAIRTQLVPGVANVPMFRDVQQKIVVFPDLGADDTEVLTYHETIEHPLFPGQFTWTNNFGPSTSWENVQVIITAPASYSLRTEAVGIEFERTEADGRARYAWHYRKTEVVAEELIALSTWDRRPRLYASSFSDYAALAAAYYARAVDKTAVTPTIQARADAITQGITDRREQARAIYEWVSLHIRYVALYLAAGGVEPHFADAVLTNGYGDCKDHTVLFEALLRAKGISAQSVLVNLDNAYTLSEPPTIAQLNHVISYLPEFDLYADTTAGVAPFGVLPFQEHGKTAILVGGEGSVERRLPMPKPEDHQMVAFTAARLDRDGVIRGTTIMTGSGPAALTLRQSARQVQTMGHDGAARRQLASLGEQGTGTYRFASPDGFGDSFGISGSFTLDALPEILEGDSFAPPLGLLLLSRPGNYLIGPLYRTTLPASEPTQCFSGHQIEDLSIELPEGYLPARLPKERVIALDDFTYTSRWTLAGRVVRVHRELYAHFDEPVCSGAQRAAIAEAMTQIRRDHRAKIVLVEPEAK